MRSLLSSKLTKLAACKSGNATLMTALGLPALLGAAGYGVDTAQMYMWQRELQHSVDQAAIGGAWALVYGEDAEYQTRASQEFYSNLAVTEDMVAGEGPSIQLANYDNGVDNSVLVSAAVTRPLPFMGVLLNQTATVSARAQAAFESGSTFHACLKTLKEDGTTFTINGSATVHANCGLGALSCDENAINILGGTVTTTSIVACGTVNAPANLDGVITEGVEGVDDYADIPIPTPNGSTPNLTYDCAGKGQNKFANPQPGKYTSIVIGCTTTFAAGIYFIEGGTLDLTYNAQVVASHVMFVLRKGATLKLGGQGNSAEVTMSPMEEADLMTTPYSANAERLAGMLFIEDKSEADEPVEHIINGNADLHVTGVFYLPNGNVKINGNAEADDTCFQIAAYTLDITGNANLKTLCDYDASSEFGTEATGVRLIA